MSLTMFRLAGLGFALTAALVSLAACRNNSSAAKAQLVAAEQTGAVPAYNTGRLSIATAKPVDAYVMLGGRIKTCWFNASAPLLPRHVYRADVSPDGEKVKIDIHNKKDARGLAGSVAYTIDFAQSGTNTIITTKNRTMTPVQAAKMQFDINRWKSGQTNCSWALPTTASR